jgi:hypothetical protein
MGGRWYGDNLGITGGAGDSARRLRTTLNKGARAILNAIRADDHGDSNDLKERESYPAPEDQTGEMAELVRHLGGTAGPPNDPDSSGGGRV